MQFIQTQFDGGRAEDARNARHNQSALLHHFDVSQRHKLIPYRDMENEAGTLAVYNIGSVELFTDSAGTQAIFALGNVSGQTYPQILEKSAVVTGTFAISTTGASASGVVIPTTLRGYKNQNKLYCLKTESSTTILESYNPASNTYAEDVGTISDTAAKGIYPRPEVHPLDDILYMAAGSTVAKLDGATFTASAVTVPSHLDIVQLIPYGVWLAIVCVPIDQGGRSVMFLWGRDTSIVEMDEAIDLGEGAALVAENLQGRIITISAPATSAGTAVDIVPTLVFRVYAGGEPTVAHEMRWEGTGTPTTRLKNLKAKHKDDLYFAAIQFLENKTVNQVWRCGFNQSGEFFVTPDRLVNNDTALTGTVDGLDIIGDYMWVAYNGDGSLKRTNDAATYTATCIYESPTLRSGNTETVKGASIHFEALPADGQVVLKYRVDENTSWTTVKTYTTNNGVRFDASPPEFTTKDGKEWHLRVESTGGAIITGVEFYSSIKKDKSYV